MRLSQLLSTSSFRLTLLYAGLTGVSFVMLFAVVLLVATHFMDRQIDDTVATELTEIQSRSGDDPARRRELVRQLTADSEGYFYLLQDAAGRVQAGNLPALPPRTGIQELTPPPSERHRLGGFRRAGVIRGAGLQLAGGGFLFVGMTAYQRQELQEMIGRAFLLGLGAAMLLALAGGAVMSASVLKRIESVSMTSRDIVCGDLDRRIALRGSGDEFDHLATSLNAMLDRIQGLMEGLRQVSTDIAHDLRTPLTRLRQRLESAQRRGLADPRAVRELLDTTLADIDGILETFSALLRIAQAESGARRAEFAAVDLSEVLHTAAEMYQPALEARQQPFTQHIEPGLSVRGDRELLMQLFANLLENAARHCPPGTAVHLEAGRDADGVRVTVADRGPGIPADQRQLVLRRFYRLETSRTTPGNGLGLSLAAAVAALHDTRLTLEDNAPGLTVSVRLAAAPDPPLGAGSADTGATGVPGTGHGTPATGQHRA
ncbi:MAG TPA: HAMP domain-containing sensor histidine kinase [Steroidobacteraceae bacterium]|nr:HAMP domain-containing sensor histidine kinase [Steroidobacteraceae bacterium]